MKCVGIDIGTYSIKVAELESTPKSYVIQDYFEIPILGDSAQDRRIQILEALQKVAAHFDPARTRYIACVSQQDVSVRRKLLPLRERYKILRSLPFELEDEIPFEQDDAIFDAKVIRYVDVNSDLLAIACPKSRVQTLIELLNDAGIDPEIVSLDSFALANNFESWSTPPPSEDDAQGAERDLGELGADSQEATVIAPLDPAQMIIDIGHTKTLVTVFHRGSLVATRALYFGGKEIVEAIRKKYAISYIEALKIFKERGFVLTNREGATHDQTLFSDTISAALKRLIDELRLTLLELKSELHLTFDKIGLLGGSSQMLNLAAYMTQQLEVPVNPQKYFDRHPRVEIPVQDEIERNAAIAIGLAIEGFKRPRNPAINFRQKDFARESQTLRVFFERWSHTLALGAVAFFCILIFTLVRSNLATSLLDTTESRIIDTAKKPPFNLKGTQANVSGARKFVNQKKRELADQQVLAALNTIQSPLDILNRLTQNVPPKDRFQLDLHTFSLHEEVFLLQGEVKDPLLVQAVRTALEKMSLPQSVKETKPEFVATPGKVAFGFSAKVTRKPTGVQ